MLPRISQPLNAFLHLFFPSSCVHCEELLPPSQQWLCSSCQQHFQLLPCYPRCPHCFCEIEEQASVCRTCAWHPSLFRGVAAAFDHEGPCRSLLHAFKYQQGTQLAKTFAAFLVAQTSQLDWPRPDVVVAVPSSLRSNWQRGYQPAYLLAKDVAHFFSVPCVAPLGKTVLSPKQTGKSREKRLELPSTSMYWKKKANLTGKVVFLIDDVMTTGRTLHCCAEKLWQGRPRSLYALIACRSD